MSIHPLSLVSPQAKIGRNVVIGPYSIVEADAEIGDGCELSSGVVVKSGVTLGPDNRVMEGTVLGGPPQHTQMPAEDRPGADRHRQHLSRELHGAPRLARGSGDARSAITIC